MPPINRANSSQSGRRYHPTTGTPADINRIKLTAMFMVMLILGCTTGDMSTDTGRPRVTVDPDATMLSAPSIGAGNAAVELILFEDYL